MAFVCSQMLQSICELHSIETALLIYRDNCVTVNDKKNCNLSQGMPWKREVDGKHKKVPVQEVSKGKIFLLWDKWTVGIKTNKPCLQARFDYFNDGKQEKGGRNGFKILVNGGVSVLEMSSPTA